MGGMHSTGQRTATVQQASKDGKSYYTVSGHDYAPGYEHVTINRAHALDLAEMVEMTNKEDRQDND